MSIEHDRLDNVRRALRVASEWKRDALIPHEQAAALLEVIEPRPGFSETDAAHVVAVAKWLAREGMSGGVLRELRRTDVGDAIMRLAGLADEEDKMRAGSISKGPYR